MAIYIEKATLSPLNFKGWRESVFLTIRRRPQNASTNNEPQNQRNRNYERNISYDCINCVSQNTATTFIIIVVPYRTPLGHSNVT